MCGFEGKIRHDKSKKRKKIEEELPLGQKECCLEVQKVS